MRFKMVVRLRQCHKHFSQGYRGALCCQPVTQQSCGYSTHVVPSPYPPVEIPNKLITEMVWETVDKYPEITALKCGLSGRTYTFSQVQKLSLKFANSLRKLGFTKGDVLALVLPNCPEFAVITLGALEAELVVSLINHGYTADEMAHQLADSGSVCIVSGCENLDVVSAAIKKVEQKNNSKQFRNIIAVDSHSEKPFPSGVVRFTEMVSDSVDHYRHNHNRTQASDLAFLPYSSGTTGLSKGVCLTHKNIVANIYQISDVGAIRYLSPDEGEDKLLGLLPFYHIYGLAVILLNSLKNGSQVVTLPKFEQDTFIKSFDNEKYSILMLVPPLILFMGSSPKVTPEQMSRVRLVFSGAAPLGASDLERVKRKLPSSCIISQGYGMTELSPVVTVPLQPTTNMATVGAPIPNTLGKIINPETGESLPPNESGELCFKGPQVMLGYHNNPTATADMIDAEGWLRTGDLGYYDEHSHFYVQDRMKELIKVKGLQVAPAELEEVLRTHPLVSDVGVIGIPDARSGEVPVAYIVPHKHEKVTAEQIKEFLSEKVSKHKQVADVIFIDAIPKSAAGKILRKDLRKMYKDNH